MTVIVTFIVTVVVTVIMTVILTVIVTAIVTVIVTFIVTDGHSGGEGEQSNFRQVDLRRKRNTLVLICVSPTKDLLLTDAVCCRHCNEYGTL